MPEIRPGVFVREAIEDDSTFVIELMQSALDPYYGGDHRAHAQRIFSTHVSGGKDRLGFFSFEQKMFVLEIERRRAGIVHVVGKRQGTYKISPLILSPEFRGKGGYGSLLLSTAEEYARENQARQMYCTVAEQNKSALQFFTAKGYFCAGRSDSHYKAGITEVMLYKPFASAEATDIFDRPNISVLSMDESHEPAVRALLLEHLPSSFDGIDDNWVSALFDGYRRRKFSDVNQKYKLIFIASDRAGNVLGVAAATPKKGEPIKIMPLVSPTMPGFAALLSDVPFLLREFGRKLYVHISPTADQTRFLQQRGWHLDAAMPSAYHENIVTQQWSMDLTKEDFMRTMRVKKRYLDLIKSGRKTLEVRVGYSSVNTIQAEERIRLMSMDESQVVRVREVRRYRCFEEMLAKEDPLKIVPDVHQDQVLPMLKEIYPPDKETLGVVVLEIQRQA